MGPDDAMHPLPPVPAPAKEGPGVRKGRRRFFYRGNYSDTSLHALLLRYPPPFFHAPLCPIYSAISLPIYSDAPLPHFPGCPLC